MTKSQLQIYTQILKNNPKINKQYAENLSLVISNKSKEYNVPTKVFTAILMQESRYNLNAVNLKCGVSVTTGKKDCVITDFGVSQIHYLNVKRFNFDKKRLVSDLTYSVDAGAKILSNYVKFQKKEPKTWYSRYNCGNRSFEDIKNTCLDYKSKVDKYM